MKRMATETRPVIVTRLWGGQGNQMFQYALGRRLALERGARLKLDLGAFAVDPLRTYALHHLRIEADIASPEEVQAFRPPFSRLFMRFAPLRRWLTPRFIIEQGFPYDARVLRAPRSAYLARGYWQTEKYFAPVADTIRADFQLLRPMAPSRMGLRERLSDCASVSVHVRRGDYVANAVTNAYHGTCAPDWYAQAMAVMAKKVPGVRFFVFSDDPQWARSNLPTDWPIAFVDPSDDGRDYEDMHLMAACRHHITANSSFSWWGAWLNPSPAKIVIAPRQWFREARNDTRDLVPESWLRL